MNPSDRFKAVKENHGCYSCLKRAGRDHNMSNCSRRRQCNEMVNGGQCKSFHHPLRHNGSPNSAVAISSVTNDREAMLPIVLAEILGIDRASKQGNVLLDSGVQISVIRSSVAEELRLKGKDVTITIAKVAGEEEEITSKMFRVRVRSLENKVSYSQHSRGDILYKQQHLQDQSTRSCKAPSSRKGKHQKRWRSSWHADRHRPPKITYMGNQTSC